MTKVYIGICIAVALCDIAFGIWQSIRTRKVMARLEEMLGEAMTGDFTEKEFSENRISRIESKFYNYINSSAVSAVAVKNEWDKIKTKPINITLRNVIGVSLETDQISGINDAVAELLANKEQYRETIDKTLHEHVYNVGKSRQLCGKYIVKSLGK